MTNPTTTRAAKIEAVLVSWQVGGNRSDYEAKQIAEIICALPADPQPAMPVTEVKKLLTRSSHPDQNKPCAPWLHLDVATDIIDRAAAKVAPSKPAMPVAEVLRELRDQIYKAHIRTGDGSEACGFEKMREHAIDIIDRAAAKAQEPAPVDRGELRERIARLFGEQWSGTQYEFADKILALLPAQAPAQGDEKLRRLRANLSDHPLLLFSDDAPDEIRQAQCEVRDLFLAEIDRLLAEGKPDDWGDDVEHKEPTITADFDTPQLRAVRLARRQIESLVCTTPGEVAIRASVLEIFTRMARSFQ